MANTRASSVGTEARSEPRAALQAPVHSSGDVVGTVRQPKPGQVDRHVPVLSAVVEGRDVGGVAVVLDEGVRRREVTPEHPSSSVGT